MVDLWNYSNGASGGGAVRLDSGVAAAGATEPPPAPALEVLLVSKSFERRRVLDEVSLSVGRGQVRALLGPNGAGKTTLLRILSGLVMPDSGSVRVCGLDPSVGERLVRRKLGLIPSGDRTFYLRLSGLENLVFFARLHGMRRGRARERAYEVLEQVELVDAARLAVQKYSHGMQKRLSVARALLTEPGVFLVDEATHDLDPAAARNVIEIVKGLCRDGAAVIWATQRLDEIRGFADSVSLLSRGHLLFNGSVPELMSHATPRRFLLRLDDGLPGHNLDKRVAAALAGRGSAESTGGNGSGHLTMRLHDDVVLGDALAALAAANLQVLACREERSEIEEAFLSLTQSEAR
jgi:ABC-type multidrug transport system ATPase subunit